MVGAGVVSGVLVALFAAAWSLFLLLAMNGFSGRQATKVLVVYGVLALGAIVVSGAGASALAARLAKGRPVGFGSAALAALGTAAAGSVALAVVSVVALVAFSAR